MLTEFITTEMLAEFAGVVAIVCALTQGLKKYLNIDPKWIALILSFLSVLITQILPQPLALERIILGLFNTLVVSSAATGVFEGVKSVGRRFMGK